jgi:hypothetical protein
MEGIGALTFVATTGVVVSAFDFTADFTLLFPLPDVELDPGPDPTCPNLFIAAKAASFLAPNK